jgi:hypothetical protein
MVVEPLSEESPRQLLRGGQRLSLDSLYAGELQRRRNDKSIDAMESSSIDLTHTPESHGDLAPGYALPPGHERYSEDEDDDLSMRDQRKGTPHPNRDYVVPKFQIGTQVTFCDNEAHVSGGGKITKVIKPGERGNHYRSLLGAFDPEMEVLYEIDTVAATQPGHTGWIRESVMWKTKDSKKRKVTTLPVGKTKALHPLDHVGIDTCSAVSVSTEIADFIYLDTSLEARNSLSLNGVGEGGPVILGRGPMIISTIDVCGDQVFMLDPAGVYVKGSEQQARMRILGQQRMNSFGFNIVQDYKSRTSRLNYRDKVTIPLIEKSGILMVKSIP